MEPNKLLALIKFGEKKYMQDLFENGTVYMNSISYFRKIEGDSLRQDPHEGTHRITQVQGLKLKSQANGAEIEFSRTGSKGRLTSAQLRESYPDHHRNLYCMYGISTEWSYRFDRIDPRNIGFGSSDPYMVVIHKPTNFIDRIKSAVQEIGLRGGHGGVTYYNPETYEGALGIFYKPLAFEYQSEFRVVVEKQDDKQLCLTIGSLRDIAYLMKADNLADLRILFDDDPDKVNS